MPALYPTLSKEGRGLTEWTMEMQHVGQAARSSCNQAELFQPGVLGRAAILAG